MPGRGIASQRATRQAFCIFLAGKREIRISRIHGTSILFSADRCLLSSSLPGSPSRLHPHGKPVSLQNNDQVGRRTERVGKVLLPPLYATRTGKNIFLPPLNTTRLRKGFCYPRGVSFADGFRWQYRLLNSSPAGGRCDRPPATKPFCGRRTQWKIKRPARAERSQGIRLRLRWLA